MSTRHLLDPSLHPLLDLVPSFQFSLENLQRFRNRGRAAVLGDARAQGVKREAVTIPGPDYDVPCLLYVPLKTQTQIQRRAGYLHIHGGGYVAGGVKGSDAMNTRIAAELGVVVLTVGYRLAPEHPVPAALDDCYTALGWLHQQAGTLGIDRQRIAVGGESAGGGLAAALAIHARDLGEFAIRHQHLTYPMLDDRTGTEASPGDP